MTNKEAIYELNMMKRMVNADSVADKAFDLAIKALEEKPIDDLSEYSDKLWKQAYERGKAEARPQEVNCSHCDYFKFAQSFIENVVKFMTDYNIETVEGLMKELNHINELLGGSNVFRS